MTNQETATSSLINGLAQVVVPVYEDIAQPAAREVGKALQTVAKTVNIALTPISMLVWGYEQIKDFVCEKVTGRLKDIPPENIVTPAPNVAVPLLDALRYTGYESALCELYANLLAASMDKSMKGGAHPAFVEIIKQLTPDEARLINLFADPHLPFPLLTIRWEHKNPTTERRGGLDVCTNFSLFASNAGLEYSDQMPVYIGNLSRLRLIEIPEFFEYTTPGVYQALENASEIKSLKERIESNPDLICVVQKKGIKITDFGKQFIRICVPPKES